MTLAEIDRPDTAATAPGPQDRVRLRAPRGRRRLERRVLALVVIALLAAGAVALWSLGYSLDQLQRSIESAERFVARMLPLDFSDPGAILDSIGTTLAIVTLGTALSLVLSLPLAFVAARTTMRLRAPRLVSRAAIVLARAIPDVVMALLFAQLLGLGALPGVLALGLHSIGMIGKLSADAIEQIDEGPREAVRATGAGGGSTLVLGVLPQIFPAVVAITLHRFDINLRASVILGFVGVAGIGSDLAQAIARLNYPRAMALALVILVMCVVLEVVSGWLRRIVLGAAASDSRRRRWFRRTRTAVTPATSRPVVPVGAAGEDPGAPLAGTARRIDLSVRQRALRWGAGVAVLGVLALSAVVARLDLGAVPGAVERLPWLLGKLASPSFGGIRPELLEGLVETLVIAAAATLIAIVVATPLASMAARNVAPRTGTRLGARFTLVTIRGVPELIVAIIFIILTGLGPQAGTLALAIGGIGLFGKLLADSLEEVPAGPEAAVRSVGARRGQVFASATTPQATPAFAGHALYLLDSNVRSATILGIVGGGGLGFYLTQAGNLLLWDVVSMIVLMITGVVLLIELLGMWIRTVLSR